MANNDTLSYSASENVTPSGEATVSGGATITKQATRMGLVIVVELTDADPIDGNYTVIVETADAGEPASGDWLENVYDSVTLNAVGTYFFPLTMPVIDKVRARIEADGATPDAATFRLRWLCDTELTLIS